MTFWRIWLLSLAAACLLSAGSTQPLRLGSRLELFVDDYLIERVNGAELVLHHPQRREIVMVTDRPWEGNACHYRTVFRDGDIFRMFYGAQHYDPRARPMQVRPGVLCYAESDDGIHWRRPDLNLVSFQGSTKNNIVLNDTSLPAIPQFDSQRTVIFKDANPRALPEARYKAITAGKDGLYALSSPDGFHWSLLNAKPVITQGMFDSQNLAFWDTGHQIYRAYIRDFRNPQTDAMRSAGDKAATQRNIATTTSRDFLHWSAPRWLRYPGAAEEQLYTSQVTPYERDPHVLLGFPMRYTDRGWSDAMRRLPGLSDREARSEVSPRYGTVVTDALFMSSRDGVTFRRWPDAFVRPGPYADAWVYGDNSVAWGIAQTSAAEVGAPPELSLYSVEHYWQGNATHIRRHTLRIDGFVSIHASAKGGEFLTRPLVLEGGELSMNFSTAASGSVQIEIQGMDGEPIPGFALANSPVIFGDAIDYIVPWKAGMTLERFSGRTVRLRFMLKDADIYSIRFRTRGEKPEKR